MHTRRPIAEARRAARVLAILLAVPLSAQAPTKEEVHVQRPLPSAEEIAKLPSDGGSEFNRLVFEQSPYLLQHARNPVDWYPWGEEAFQRARDEDRPVFLSVGYSTCHWCHVMERESFEDEEVAALLNEHFVCVKVDREERPDVDQVYMSVTQAMTGRGGWPMTVIMTADARPFFAGTYFPKQSRGGRRGMMELVPLVADVWANRRSELLETAGQIVEHLTKTSGNAPGGPLTATVLDLGFAQLSERYDEQHGGFTPAPKFPRPHSLRFLLRYAARTGNAEALQMVEDTLRGMRRGGVWDHVGLGFHRYSTDAEWLVPHFEKMLYDQALLATTYVEAWQATGADDFRHTAEEILAYVMRDMTSREGGFFSAEDADSEGEEGLFYLWTVEELTSVLGAEDGRFAAELWGATVEGNFLDEATRQKTGRNILHLDAELSAIVADGTQDGEPGDVSQLRERVEGIRQRLFAAREPRIHPLKDDKVLTDWNGLMIAAFSMAARAFDEPRYERAARRAADFVLGELRDDDGRLYKRYRGGDAALPGLLEDYAFVVWGLLELHETSFDLRYLSAAVELNGLMLEHFWDDEQGGLFVAPDDGEKLIVRAKDIYDGAIPAGNSVAASNFLRLARLTGDTDLEDRADELFRAFSLAIGQVPQGYTHLLLALDFAVGPSHEIVIAGERDAADTRAMLRAIGREFAPNKVVLLRPPGAATELAKLVPYVASMGARDGRATAYVCREFACKAPTHDLEEVLGALRSADPRSRDE